MYINAQIDNSDRDASHESSESPVLTNTFSSTEGDASDASWPEVRTIQLGGPVFHSSTQEDWTLISANPGQTPTFFSPPDYSAYAASSSGFAGYTPPNSLNPPSEHTSVEPAMYTSDPQLGGWSNGNQFRMQPQPLEAGQRFGLQAGGTAEYQHSSVNPLFGGIPDSRNRTFIPSHFRTDALPGMEHGYSPFSFHGRGRF